MLRCGQAGRIARIALVPIAVSLISLLAACSEVELAAQASKDMNRDTPQTKGYYKVGKPYQVSGVWYYPAVDYSYDETGIGSWYGPGFHGRQTANGERYDQNALTAAHPTLPMPTLVEVTNLENGRSIEVRINDRGPFKNGRVIDMSKRGAELLGFHKQGTAKVRVRVLETESRQLAAAAQGGRYTAATPISADRAPAPEAVPVQEVTVENLAGQPVGTQSSARAVVLSPARAATPPEPEPNGQVRQQPVGHSDIYVQAGAFTQYHNANRLAAQLSDLGSVRVDNTMVGDTAFYRVQVGPVGSVEQADLLLGRLLENGFTDSTLVVQ